MFIGELWRLPPCCVPTCRCLAVRYLHESQKCAIKVIGCQTSADEMLFRCSICWYLEFAVSERFSEGHVCFNLGTYFQLIILGSQLCSLVYSSVNEYCAPLVSTAADL